MSPEKLVHVAVFPGWISTLTITTRELATALAWNPAYWGAELARRNPELVVLNDGELYPTSQDAIAAGRAFIHYSIGAEPDRESRRE